MNKDGFLIIAAIISSNVLLEVVKSWIFFRKNTAEVGQITATSDHNIVKMYQSIVADLKDEVNRLKLEVDDVRQNESLWIERYNQLAQSNFKLIVRIEALEKEYVKK